MKTNARNLKEDDLRTTLQAGVRKLKKHGKKVIAVLVGKKHSSARKKN